MKEVKEYCPQISEIIEKINCSDKSISYIEFDKMPNISIDYAVMERVKILLWLNLNLIGKI